MKWILTVLIILFSNIYAFDLKKADFATFCNYVSYQTNMNIVISDDVSTNFSVFMPTDNMNTDALKNAFFKILKVKKLRYDIYDNTILIYKYTKPVIKPVKNTFVVRFNYIPANIVSNYLKQFYPNSHFQIFQNRILINTTLKNYLSIKDSISKLDNSYKKAKINFLISVINNKKAQTFNINNNLHVPAGSRFLLNLVTSTSTLTSSLPHNYSFTSFINFLNSKGLAETVSKPTIYLIDSHNYTLESVQNIPYVTKSVTTDKEGNPVTQTDLKYKDVGLKIYIKNVFITKDTIDFDLDLFVQNIVAYMKDNQPVTDVKHFNTHIQLTKNNSQYLIAGLRSVTTLNNSSNVPVLSKIPLIGLLFKTKDKKVEDLTFTIFINTNYFKNDANLSLPPRSDAGAPQGVVRDLPLDHL